MSIDYDSMSLEELEQIQGMMEQQDSTASGSQVKDAGVEKGFIESAGDKLTAARAGFHGSLSDLGEDAINFGRTFITDPVGLTDSKITRERERTLGTERAREKEILEQKGLSGSYGAGSLLADVATIAAPGGLAAKGAKAAIAGKGALAGAGRIALGQGGLGAAVGAVKGQGDIADRGQAAAGSAALFTAGGAAGSAIGAGIGRVARNPAVNKLFDKVKVPMLPSQAAKEGTVGQRILKGFEEMAEKVPLTGVKKVKVGQVDRISKLADDLLEMSSEGDRLIRSSGRSIERLVANSEATIKSPAIFNSINKIKSRFKSNGDTSVLNKLTKKFPEEDLVALKDGTMSPSRFHELRTNMDDIINSLKTGGNVGKSKAGLQQIQGLRKNMENLLEKSIKKSDRANYKPYLEAKKVFQEGRDQQKLKAALDEAFDSGEFNSKTFLTQMKKLSKGKNKLSANSDTQARKLANNIREVLRITGTKGRPSTAPSVNDLGVLAGAGGATAGLGVALGTAPAAAITGSAILGIRTLMSTKVGQKLLLKHGTSTSGRKLLAEMAGRLGAEEARKSTQDSTVEDTVVDYDSMSLEQLEELAKQAGIE